MIRMQVLSNWKSFYLLFVLFINCFSDDNTTSSSSNLSFELDLPSNESYPLDCNYSAGHNFIINGDFEIPRIDENENLTFIPNGSIYGW